MRFTAYIFLLIFSFFIFTKAESQRCDEISTSFALKNESSNINFSLIFDVVYFEHSNFITVKSFKAENLSGILSPANGFQLCFTSASNSSNCFDPSKLNHITTTNGFIAFSLELLSNFHTFTLFYGFLDGGNIIPYNGALFSDENKCVKYNDKDFYYLTRSSPKNLTTCCSSFKAVTKAPTNFPKCITFKATSSKTYKNVYYSTISAEFILADTNIKATGISDSTYYNYAYGINGFQCQRSIGNTFYCDYSFNGFENELMIQFSDSYGEPLRSFVGRIILRDNITFMEEGIPFTSSNNCLKSNITGIYGEWNIINEFCCINFDDFTKTTAPPSTVIPSQNPLFQKCEKIKSVSSTTNYLNTSISSEIEILSYKNEENIISMKNVISSVPLTFENSSSVVCLQIFNGDQRCFGNSTSTISVNNEMFFLISPWKTDASVHAYTNDGSPFYLGIIDEGSFFSFDGSIFSDNKNCSFYQDDDTNVTSCCTSLKPFSKPTPRFPKCTNFRVTSIVHNITSDSTLTPLIVDFVLTETFISAIGYLNDVIYPVFTINGAEFQRGVNNTQFGGYPLSQPDNVLLINIEYPITEDQYTIFSVVFVGRIIVRDGQTFMAENVPFYGNDCQNFNQTYEGRDVYVVSQLCCTKYSDDFNGNTTPTTIPSSSTVPVAYGYFKIFLFMLFLLKINFV